MKTMKATTYIQKILAEGACSVATAEKLTEALHREGLLHPHLSVRFKILFGNFDIVETEWLKGNIKKTWFYPIIEFPNIITDCARATELYTPYFEAVQNFLKNT